jgi:hypothetical protein
MATAGSMGWRIALPVEKDQRIAADRLPPGMKNHKSTIPLAPPPPTLAAHQCRSTALLVERPTSPPKEGACVCVLASLFSCSVLSDSPPGQVGSRIGDRTKKTQEEGQRREKVSIATRICPFNKGRQVGG